MRTLLLDVNYLPVKIVSWQKAITLLVTGRAEMVDEYSDKIIRSVSLSLKLPKILRLYQTHKLSYSVRFTRLNVFYRDSFECQYCSMRLPPGELTFDHVVPVSREGKTCWENVVTCCKPCNSKKGSKTPSEAHMKLRKPPRKPNWSPELCLRLKEDDPTEWWDFFPKKQAMTA